MSYFYTEGDKLDYPTGLVFLTSPPRHRTPTAMGTRAHRKAAISPHLSARKPKRRGEIIRTKPNRPIIPPNAFPRAL